MLNKDPVEADCLNKHGGPSATLVIPLLVVVQVNAQCMLTISHKELGYQVHIPVTSTAKRLWGLLVWLEHSVQLKTARHW